MSSQVLSSSRQQTFEQSSKEHRPSDPRVPGQPSTQTAENVPLSRAAEKPSSRRASIDAKSSFAARRRSGAPREHKAPLGPRPPDFSSSRRTTTAAPLNADSTPSRAYLPNTTLEPFLGLSARRNPSISAPARNNNTQTPATSNTKHSSSRTTSVQLNDTDGTTSDPRLEDFPRPGGQGRKSAAASNGSAPQSEASSTQSGPGPLAVPDFRATARKRPSQSPVRQGSATLHVAQVPSGQNAMSSNAVPLEVKTRRQSTLPPSTTTNTAARQPRKSIGPGYSIPTAREKTAFDPASRTFVPVSKLDLQSGRTKLSVDAIASGGTDKLRENAGHTPVSWAEGERSARSKRDSKARSIQKTPQSSQSRSAPLDLPPPVNSFQFSSEAKSPGKGTQSSTSTPGSSSKRHSVSNNHVGGLGARTVSPTDARRSRRMSTMAQPPPMPTRSPTPDAALRIQGTATPPFAVPVKAATPSSARGTPDLPQRISFHRSVSSRSSYSSVRPTSSSSQQRGILGNNANGRTSVTKSRNVHSSAGEEIEAVPPVPAIPKAFESPSDTSEKPFFDNIMTTITSNERESVESISADRFVTPVENLSENPPWDFPEAKQSRRLTLGSRPEPDKDTLAANGGRGLMDGSRLPPLNLLPLSTPTTARIASFSQKNTEADGGRWTPPPKNDIPKTPSTPMTASKATFPTFRASQGFDFGSFPAPRSNTSHGTLRTDLASLDGPASGDSPASLTPQSANTPRQGPSPFGSFSVPRAPAEFPSHLTRASIDTGKARAVTTKTEPTKPIKEGPNKLSKAPPDRRPSLGRKGSKDALRGQHATTPTEGDLPPPGTSLRRKLSLGWRRSSSKASHHSQHADEELSPQLPNIAMPPPKLPASAAANGPSKKSPRLSSKPFPSKESTETLTLSVQSSGSSAAEARPTSTVLASRSASRSAKSSSSLFLPMQKMLGSRNSSHNLKISPSESALDRDDMAAEEEMKKLAGRRKEFEVAARDLEDLRKKATPKERVSPSQASRMASLNIFERGEIIDYREIYFCGVKNAKKYAGDLSSEGTNFGFDDERGDYNIVLGDHLAYRYEVIDMLGKGSFGQVARCIDHKTGRLVAIKIIRNKKRFHQQALVEVNILQRLREWDPQSTHSMIKFTQSFYFRGHLCISTELLGINLYEFIKAHDFVGFSLKLIRRFTKQMLASLCLLQTRKVIHCDLKPENVLLAHPLHSEIKVIDFGSSCFENEKVYTYIQSRFYRSPEVILGMDYGMPIDMWSLGCILAELFTGYPLFPGENEQEQLACIMEVFGPPEKHLIEKSSRRKLFFDSLGKPRITVSSKGKRRRPSSKTLSQALKSDDEVFLDFIARCLRWDPERRIKPDEAMKHDFVTGNRRGVRTRSQHTGSGAASPARRSTVAHQTPVKTGTQADPPTTSYKNGIPAESRAVPSSSPMKGSAQGSRRKSTVNEPGKASGGTSVTKPTGNMQTSGSALPRIAPTRTASGKPDLASAAAIASLGAGGKSR